MRAVIQDQEHDGLDLPAGGPEFKLSSASQVSQVCSVRVSTPFPSCTSMDLSAYVHVPLSLIWNSPAGCVSTPAQA